jgi:hypothetical protein
MTPLRKEENADPDDEVQGHMKQKRGNFSSAGILRRTLLGITITTRGQDELFGSWKGLIRATTDLTVAAARQESLA